MGHALLMGRLPVEALNKRRFGYKEGSVRQSSKMSTAFIFCPNRTVPVSTVISKYTDSFFPFFPYFGEKVLAALYLIEQLI